MSQQTKHLEIERRWLLSELPNSEILTAIGVRWMKFTTVYVLSDSELEVRIRRRSYQHEITYSVVTKLGHGLTRQETPKLSATDSLFFLYYSAMSKPYTEKEHIEIVLPSGQKWEINRFHQPSGLILAEMEFDSEEAAKQFSEQDFPKWLKPLVVKEVTDDPRYNGKNLAVYGRPNPE